ncbi:hypothetical protein B7494_g6600 [Chlorociboria aeruginascens]|nr:hypothetical protein B7494_g6600 [Chlorociboria aeruginascens]
MFSTLSTVVFFLLTGSYAVDLSTLPDLLKNISADVYPDLQGISMNIWENPEIGLSEFHAHDLIVDYFTSTRPGEWEVTPHAYGMPTAWTLEFEYRPPATSPTAVVPVIGIMAEYDALVAIGHACGHNHIALVALALASLTRQAVLDLGIPAHLIVVGTPDEEEGAGKHTLWEAGAFENADIWMLAHPTDADAITALNSRLNVIADFVADTHEEAVYAAYEAMTTIRDLDSSGKWPGSNSSAAPVEDVGMFQCNVVQGQISLGIAGSTVATVGGIVNSLLADKTYPNVSCSVLEDATMDNGVNVTCLGPGGHASSDTNGPLVLTIETFRTLSSNDGLSFYLPGNTTLTELDVTFDLRTRYTTDIDSVGQAVISAIQDIATSTATDVMYPSMEITPVLPERLISLVATPDYGSQEDWILGGFTPASTDASWPQGAVLDPETHALIHSDKVVFQPFWNLCEPGGICAFNHEPLYREVAGTNYSYTRTEIMARALAHIAVELLNDPAFMLNATAITN